MKVFFIIIAFHISFLGSTQIPFVKRGKIERLDSLNSQFVSSRNVDVWLPDNYNNNNKYPVLYMHDGQMLFDTTVAWNKMSWDVDDVASKLIDEGKIKEFIIVAIWNDGKQRHIDYFPQKPYNLLSFSQKNYCSEQLNDRGFSNLEYFSPNSDNYLKYIIYELKPKIDNKYSTFKDSSHTFIAGSSMGGLISIYALCEYPNIFGGAICMSTHWTGIFNNKNNPIPKVFLDYLAQNLPNPKNHKIYFDYGNKTLDQLYPIHQKKVDKLMKSKGYDKKSWITKFYPGENHSELAWHKRFDQPLLFLFGM